MILKNTSAMSSRQGLEFFVGVMCCALAVWLHSLREGFSAASFSLDAAQGRLDDF